MNDPNAYLAREIDRLANDYHAMGNHNRAIARKRIAEYQERKFYAPNHAQMQSAVKGGEQYRFHHTPLARRILRWIKNWSDRT